MIKRHKTTIMFVVMMLSCQYYDMDNHPLDNIHEYSVSETLWDGGRWSGNRYQGYWFPMSDSIGTYFGINNTSIGQLHSVDSIRNGFEVEITLRLLLNSVSPTNTESAFIGFGERWYSYGGISYGVLFSKNRISYVENSIVKDSLGYFESGDTITVKLSNDHAGICNIAVGKKVVHKFPGLQPSIRRLIISAMNCDLGHGFSVLNTEFKQSLFLMYPMNGNAVDASGLGNHGTLFGPVSSLDRSSIPNASLLFDGINDSIVIGNREILNNAENFSFSAWVYYEGSGGINPVIISKGTDIFDIRILQVSDNNHLEVSLNGDTGRSIHKIPLNTWTHIVFVKNGTTGEIFINTQFSGRFTFAKNIRSEARSTLIGAAGQTPGIDNFKGRIDDVRIYRKAIDAEEMLELYVQ